MSESRPSLPTRLVAGLGAKTLGLLSVIGGAALLVTETTRWFVRGLTSPDVRLGRQAVSAQIVRVGTRSIAIVLVVSACIGLILAMAMYPPLQQFGQEATIANIVAIAISRELGANDLSHCAHRLCGRIDCR